MINNWHSVVSIPTVQLNTSAALQKHLVDTTKSHDFEKETITMKSEVSASLTWL